MTRALEINRDQAELLDDLLRGYVERDRNGFDIRAIDMAEDLRETWGWSRWDKRPESRISTEEYDKWVNRVFAWLTDLG